MDMSESPTDLDTSAYKNTPRDDARNGQVTADQAVTKPDGESGSNQTPDDTADQATRKKRRPFVMVIGLGVVMLMQPFSLNLYSYSFVTILAGTLGFVIVSHFPD